SAARPFASWCCVAVLRALLSFPTRRSSDMHHGTPAAAPGGNDRQTHVSRGRRQRRRGRADERRGGTANGRRRCHSCPSDGLGRRSVEHTSELQSRENLVCRLLLEKKKVTPA